MLSNRGQGKKMDTECTERVADSDKIIIRGLISDKVTVHTHSLCIGISCPAHNFILHGGI